MTPDYASLDAAIVKAIREMRPVGYRISEEAKLENGWDEYHEGKLKLIAESFLGERIESLRKRGLIVYNNGRWSAVEKV